MLTRYLEVVAGDTLSFRIVVKDGVSPVDISGVNFVGGVKQVGAANVLAPFKYEIVDARAGLVRIYLTPDQTRTLAPSDRMYEWFVRIESPNYAKTLTTGGLRVVRL